MKRTTIEGAQSHWPCKRARPVKHQAEFELRETVEEFEKDMMAIVKSFSA